jgi:hypothetical protein
MGRCSLGKEQVEVKTRLVVIAGLILAMFAVSVPAFAARIPEVNFDGGYWCDQAGGNTVVWLTREYRWPGTVKIWDGKPFVRKHLRRAVTYRDLRDSPEGGVVVGELADGLHRFRSTYKGHILDRQRIRIRCGR